MVLTMTIAKIVHIQHGVAILVTVVLIVKMIIMKKIEYDPNDYDNLKVLDAIDIACLIGEPIRVRNLENEEMINVIVDWVLFEKDEFEVGVANCDDVYSNSDYGFYQY
jgi:hypothetical protein